MRREDLAEADGVTAKVINEHIVNITLLANVAIMVLCASKDINEALSLEEMVIVPAFQAGPAIRVALLALADLQPSEAEDQQEQKQRKTVTKHLFFE